MDNGNILINTHAFIRDELTIKNKSKSDIGLKKFKSMFTVRMLARTEEGMYVTLAKPIENESTTCYF